MVFTIKKWLNIKYKIRKFYNDKESNFSKLIHNSSWLIADKIIRGILSLSIGVWIARYLGPEKFGELSFVLAYLTFFQIISIAGLDGIVVRELVRIEVMNKGGGGESAGALLGTTIFIRALAGFFCWIIAIVLFMQFKNIEMEEVFLVAIIGGSLIFQSTDAIDLWYQSKSASKKTVRIKLFGSVVSSTIRVLLILLNAKLIYFAVSILFESILNSIILILSYKNDLYKLKICIKLIGKKLIIESWPLIVSGLSIIIYMRIDQMVIVNSLGTESLGIYSAVAPFATTWYSIPMLLGVSLLPLATKCRNDSIVKYNKLLLTMLISYIIISIIITIMTIFYSKYVVDIFLGKSYEEGVIPLAILGLSTIPVFIGYFFNLKMTIEGKIKYQMYMTVCGAIASIISSLILVPRLGLIGASISILVAHLVSDIVAPLYLEINLKKRNLKTL